MEKTPPATRDTGCLTYFLGGLLVAVLIVLVSGAIIVLYGLRAAPFSPTSLTPDPRITQVEDQLPAGTANPDSISVIERAYQLYTDNDLGAAFQLLEDNLEGIEDPDSILQAYQLMASIKMANGEYALAAPYLEKAYELAPDATNLFYIAETYYMAGNWRKALEYFKRCLEMESPDLPQEFRDTADQRIVELEIRLLGVTRTPTVTPAP